jgi:hypothetical protein
VPNSGTAAAPNANVPAVPKPNKPPGLSSPAALVLLSVAFLTAPVVVSPNPGGLGRWCY